MAEIIVKNVHLEFPVYGLQRSFRRALFQRAAGGFIKKSDGPHRRVMVSALSDVSLQLKDGDRLALIGHNGAGKSSLLKVLAGVYQPTQGEVWVNGKITSPFEIGPGIDTEDTGYETIITVGMLLGMTRAQIESKIPEIEHFSELGEYLSLPIRTYSTGMTTRLGFSIATVVEPEILLLDEGIGAGDARFTERAFARLQELAQRSAILVLASHSENLIRSICNKAALLRSGQLIKIASVGEILSEYHDEKTALLQSQPA